MSYDGEVDEKDWCSLHACLKNRCAWQHRETFEEMWQRTHPPTVSERQAEQLLTGQDL